MDPSVAWRPCGGGTRQSTTRVTTSHRAGTSQTTTLVAQHGRVLSGGFEIVARSPETHYNHNMTPYKTLHDIKARVTARWSHKNCKFQRGDHAEVDTNVLPRQYVKMDGGIGEGHSYVSQVKQRRVGRVGRVVAVSCLPDGRIRSDFASAMRGGASRMYTRYYIQFTDGVIMGFDSHHLDRAFDLRKC